MTQDPVPVHQRHVTARTWRRIVLGGVLVIGMLPFVPILGWLPWGSDAAKWVAWTSLANDTFWVDVAWRKHFVGYRPVAALSFVFNHLTTGYSPFGYRALDLVLHGTTGLVWVAVIRQWTRSADAPRAPGLGWPDAALVIVALLVFYGHPVTEEVVPYSARRSYLLAMTCGLSALWLFGAALRMTRAVMAWGAGLAAAGLLGLAVLSNESAFVLVPLVPAVGLHLVWGERRTGEVLVKCLPFAAITGGALALRVAVLGSLSGGYFRLYFAHVNPKGKPAWRELEGWEPLRILDAAGSYLTHPHAANGFQFPGQGWLDVPVLLLATGLVVAFAVVRPVRRRHDPVARTALIAGLWLAGSLAIIVLSRTWFWRQAYFLLPPYGLILGVATHTALMQWVRHRRRARALAVVTGLLIGFSVVHGPLLRAGMTTGLHGERSRGTRSALAMREAVEGLERPTEVLMALPHRGSRSHFVRMWQGRFFAGEGHHFRVFAHLDRSAKPETLKFDVKPDHVVLSGGYWLVDRYRKVADVDPDPAKPGSRPRQVLNLTDLQLTRRPSVIIAVHGERPVRVDIPIRDRSLRAPTSPTLSPSNR